MDLPVRMSDGERELFVRTLAKATHYMEFGSGGSTLLAIRSPAKIVLSVESDPAWLDRIREHPEIAQAVAAQRLFLTLADIGPVGEWGRPTDETRQAQWPHYYADPFFATDILFDLILIDGRFRVATALAAAACAAESATIVMHDYELRSQYYLVEKFFDIEETRESLYVLRRRKAINIRSFYMEVMRHLFEHG
ncbi:MAG: class SAM-dependent methyltransferase [Rhodospirillales bacterium]|jgi:hypothetical protein|nr:class SAM-dependent methyltransferase [Rhodospirillales bacterium]